MAQAGAAHVHTVVVRAFDQHLRIVVGNTAGHKSIGIQIRRHNGRLVVLDQVGISADDHAFISAGRIQRRTVFGVITDFPGSEGVIDVFRYDKIDRKVSVRNRSHAFKNDIALHLKLLDRTAFVLCEGAQRLGFIEYGNVDFPVKTA